MIYILLAWLCVPTMIEARIIAADFPPFVREGTDGRAVGDFVDRMGGEDISFMPWNRALKTSLTDEALVIFPVIRSPQRESSYHWLARLMRDEIVAFTHPQSKHKAAGYVLGSPLKVILERLGLTPTESARSVLINAQKLHRGRISSWIAPYQVGRKVMELLAIDADRFPVRRTGEFVDIYVAASKATDPDTVRRLTARFARIADE